MNKIKNERELIKKIVIEFEKDRTDYLWLHDNLKEYFLIDEINTEGLDRTGTALMFYFVNYKKIKKL